MARTASPWFWEVRNCWAVIINGQRHILGNHPDDEKPPHKRKNKWIVPDAIRQRFHALMSAPSVPSTTTTTDTNPTVTSNTTPSLSVAEVFEKFLEWCSQNRAPRTYDWSRNHIQSFVNSLKARQIVTEQFPAEDIRPFHVNEWVDAHKQPKPGRRAWGPNHCRGAITAVQRAFRWAEIQGHIVKSPIRNIEKPAPKRREQVLTQAEFATLLAAVKDEAFRHVLEFCWETGCRVEEVRQLEAKHYKATQGRFELPPQQAKGKKRWRLIYLTERAQAIVTPLVVQHPNGTIFRNVDGNPWDAQSFNCRFVRLKKKLGVKYALTSLRHSFATRMLEAGCDHITVAALLGHVDATMLSRVYSHVGERTDFLRGELLKVSSAEKPAA